MTDKRTYDPRTLIGNQLRTIMEARGYDLSPRGGGIRQFADEIGLSHSTVSQWLSDGRPPSLESLARAASVLRVLMTSLLPEGAEADEEPPLAIVGYVAQDCVMLDSHFPGLLVVEQQIPDLPARPGDHLVCRIASKLPPPGGWVVIERHDEVQLAAVEPGGVLNVIGDERCFYDAERHGLIAVVQYVQRALPT